MLKTTASKSTTIKVLASTVLVGGAVAVAGLGTFGAFTSTTTAQQDVASGTITLSVNDAPKGTADFGSLGGMVPGDKFERNINLARGEGDELFGSLKIEPKATNLSENGAALVKQIRADIKSCDVPWTLAAATDTTPSKLTCSTGNVVSLAGGIDLMEGATLEAGYLKDNLNSAKGQLNIGVFFEFVSTANNDLDNVLQGEKADLSFTFTATQRAGTNR